MMRTAKQLYEEVSAAFADGDMARMFNCFAEDCVIREAPGLPFGGDWVGHDGMRAMFELVAKHFELQPTLLDVYEASDSTVISYTMMRMTSKSDETVDMPVLEIFNSRDGRIVEAIPFYWDVERLARMAAASGA